MRGAARPVCFRMRKVVTIGALAAAVVGFGASITSLVDDLGGAPTFCAQAGCDIVRTSAWAKPLGIPMSLLGVLFFGAAIALAFVRAPRLRTWLAVAGGAWAVWLIGLQAFSIGAWCKVCLVADPAAIVHAALVLAGARAIAVVPQYVIPVIPGAIAVVAVLGLWTQAAPVVDPAVGQATPEGVMNAQVAGVATVVEYVDFECPHCRNMHKRLEQAIGKTEAKVRVVRKMVPLPNHRGAMPAALAYCCAEAQGLGEEMAAALFAASPEELTTEGCEAIAKKIGCDLERYRTDLASTAAERVRSDLDEAKRAGIQGLPTLFIGSERLTGASASVEELVDLIDRAPRS